MPKRSGTEGDSFYVTFAAAPDAVAAAIEAQRPLQSQTWPQDVPVRRGLLSGAMFQSADPQQGAQPSD